MEQTAEQLLIANITNVLDSDEDYYVKLMQIEELIDAFSWHQRNNVPQIQLYLN